MAWRIELARAAERELAKLDAPVTRRILQFLHERVAHLDNPRSIGEALRGKAGRFLEVSCRRLPDHLLDRRRRGASSGFACWSPARGVPALTDAARRL
jgi:hypothetical protein